MIQRRFATALKNQDWAIVAIEFVLIIVGVLLALQLNNWNEDRANREGAENTLLRLKSEVQVNIESLDERLAALESSAPARAAGLAALQSCDSSPEGIEKLAEALDATTSDFVPAFADSNLLELSRQDRYLDLLSDDFRNAMSLYSSRLDDERDQLTVNFNLLWQQHVMIHEYVGINLPTGDIFNAEFVFDQPMSVMCQDAPFKRKLAMTVGWHQSGSMRMQRFKNWSEDFIAAIDRELAD